MNPGRGGVGYDGGGGGENAIGGGAVDAGRGGVEYEGGGGMSVAGLSASEECTGGGDRNGLAVLLAMPVTGLDVGTDTLSGPNDVL